MKKRNPFDTWILSVGVLCMVVVAVTGSGCGDRNSREAQTSEPDVFERRSDGDDLRPPNGNETAAPTNMAAVVYHEEALDSLGMGDDDGTIAGHTTTYTLIGGESAEIPEGFPLDVPLFMDMKIVMTLTDGGTGYTLQASSLASIEDIVAFYTEESSDQGWSESMNMTQSLGTHMQMLVFEKKNRMMNIVVQEDGDLTSISLNVTNN